MDRPNLLILMADQLAARVLRAYGGGIARTPHIDALADEGVVFDSFYCNSPLCAPSRFSFLAGQLPSKIGAYDNAAEYPAQIPTFAHYLRRAGYQTALAGKMHFCGPDQLHGFEERLTTDIYPSDFGWTPDWSAFEQRPSWYHSMDSVIHAGACTRTNQIDFDDEVVVAARQKLFDLARSRDRRAFCLVVSMTHPHDPYVIPHVYWNRYRDEEIDLPRVPDLSGSEDPHSRRLRHVIGLDLDAPTDDQVRAARRAYYGAISFVDEQIGSVLEALGESGMVDDTIILLIGDHGEMLGERDLWYKMNFFEGGARIPMIVHAPGRFAPHRVAASVSLVDLLPTLADLAGGDIPQGMATAGDGTSLMPHLLGEPGHDEAIGEYLAEGAIAPIVMIRRDHWKFIHCPVDPDQLFDLVADPDELDNLAGDPAHVVTVAAFLREISERWELPRIEAEVLASQRRRRLIAAASANGMTKAWDYQPFRDAAQDYVRGHMDLEQLEASARFPRVRGE